MILKVRTGNGWIFISELYKVETAEMTKDKAINLDFNKEFYCIKDVEEVELKSTWVKLCYLFTKIASDLGNTEQRLDKVIVVDINATYLLNDEGKTIERIN